MPLEFTTIISLLAICGFALALIYAAYTDVREMRITNQTCLVAGLAFVPYAAVLLLQDGVATVLVALGIAAGVFVVTASMNAANALGGGDVKLLTVLALWTGSRFFLETFFIVALVGGIVGVIAYIRMMIAKSSPVMTTGDAQSAMDQRPIPYGPGISLAGLILSSELIVNALSS